MGRRSYAMRRRYSAQLAQENQRIFGALVGVLGAALLLLGISSGVGAAVAIGLLFVVIALAVQE